MSAKDTIERRGSAYGSFATLAPLCQTLKLIMRESGGWENLDPDMREALELIAMKIARILNGNPRHHDSWHDIEGYAKLVADRLADAPPHT